MTQEKGKKLRRPTRCANEVAPYEECGGTSFTKEEDRFVCNACGHSAPARSVRPVDLVAAKCEACLEPFLWKRLVPPEGAKPGWQPVPTQCQACLLAAKAIDYERRAEKLHDQAVQQRAQQRRAVARWKPPESAAEGAKHKGRRA